jgi:hypothetical protein
MSLLTGPSDSTSGCQSALVDKLGVNLSQYHPTMVHTANHPGMNNRPVEAAVLRSQSHPIIANQQRQDRTCSEFCESNTLCTKSHF